MCKLKSRFNRVIDMTRNDYRFMLENLKEIQNQIDLEEHMEPGSDEPSIDVRLCIDFEGYDPSWIIRFGLADFDPAHSELCGASCVTLDKKSPEEALEDMIDQCLDQMSQAGDYE